MPASAHQGAVRLARCRACTSACAPGMRPWLATVDCPERPQGSRKESAEFSSGSRYTLRGSRLLACCNAAAVCDKHATCSRECIARFATAAERITEQPAWRRSGKAFTSKDEKQSASAEARDFWPVLSAHALAGGSVEALRSHCSTPRIRRCRCSWSSPCSVKRNR